MQTGAGLGSLLIFALPLLLLVWLMVTQRRRGRAVADFQAGLTSGAEVVTTSGIYGTIVAIEDAVVSLQVAPGTVLRVDRRAIGMAAPPPPGSAAGPASPAPNEPSGTP